jgi:16S rRNA (cytosine967-C5)-methyltransferase
MRLHHHLIAAVVETLGQIFHKGAAADRAVEAALRQHPKWGSRDRRIFAGHVYDLVRWRRWYAWLAGDESEQDLWRMWAAYWLERGDSQEVDFPECATITAASVAARKVLEAPPAVRSSFPDWLYALAAEELGAAWPAMSVALNETASVFLRANVLKTSVPALLSTLQQEGAAAASVPGLPGALRLEKRASLAGGAAFRQGLFEVQDAASQRIAPLLGAERGMLVIDGCAGGGGKALHLATLMQNEGRIIAQDVRPAALEALRERAARAGLSIIRTEVISGPETMARRAGTADRLLLDVPCSGLGVVRRNPDTKWKLTPAELDRLTALQRDILRTAPVMLKPGGRMVYATCSILPRENEQQVRAFLESHPGAWELEEECRFSPGDEGDGFYAARLRKK